MHIITFLGYTKFSGPFFVQFTGPFYFSNDTKKAELFYSGFMLGFVNMLAPNYIISSEQESGDGQPDMVMIPEAGKGDKAMIIEYKIAKSSEDLGFIAKSGLQQIINRKYDSKIKEYSHVKQILKISMAFCGKNMELQYEVTKL